MKITKQQLKRFIREELEAVLLKEKADCFDHKTHKTFKSKSACIKRTKPGVKNPDAYVASVERERGHIEEGF